MLTVFLSHAIFCMTLIYWVGCWVLPELVVEELFSSLLPPVPGVVVPVPPLSVLFSPLSVFSSGVVDVVVSLEDSLETEDSILELLDSIIELLDSELLDEELDDGVFSVVVAG